MINKEQVPNKKQNEKVVMNLWPHPFMFFKIFLVYILLFAIPVAVYFFITWTYPAVFESQFLLPILTLICFAYYLVVLLLAFYIWMDNYLDVWTITTHRIVSREQKGLFNRTVSELELYRVQDVSVEQKGFLPTMLNYGDLYVQTAGATERFVFKNVGNPIKISRLIQRLDEDAKHQYFNPAS